MRKIELLAPAGSREGVLAAVANGADAVYFGGTRFNARIGAIGIAEDEIEGTIDYCHLRGVKAYVTLNTLCKDEELAQTLDFAGKTYRFGADAFIVQDLGLFDLLKKNFPSAKFHASTQMTTTHPRTVQALAEAGFTRVVLSRELSLAEIREIAVQTSAEIEVFAHGALCACYSGRCLMSSLIGGRSGNRGRCAQPCRLAYTLLKDGKALAQGHLLSPKDLMALHGLPALIEAGVHAVKIEGRMKSPAYAACVTDVYRRGIDRFYEEGGKAYTKDTEGERDLTQIFSRGGAFTAGYSQCYSSPAMLSGTPKSTGVCVGYVKAYHRGRNKCEIVLTQALMPGDGIEIWTRKEPHTGTNIAKQAKPGESVTITLAGDIHEGDKVYRSFDKKLTDRLNASFSKDTGKLRITGEFKAKIGKPLSLRFARNGICVEREGEITDKALNRPMSEADFLKQLSKTGDTTLAVMYTACDTDPDAYAPIAALNKLRREVCEAFTAQWVGSFKREAQPEAPVFAIQSKEPAERLLTASVRTAGQFAALADCPAVSRIYAEFGCLNPADIERAHKNGIEVFAALPAIVRGIDKGLTDDLRALEKSGVDGYLLRHVERFETKKKVALDYTHNIMNSAAIMALEPICDSLTLSPELSVKEISALSLPNGKAEAIVYGKLPLMTTALCPVGLLDAGKGDVRFCALKNKTDAQYTLKDKLGVSFTVMPVCRSCYAEIINAVPVFMLHKLNQLMTVRYARLYLTDETPAFAADLAYAFHRSLNGLRLDDRTMFVSERVKKTGFTYGHFFRGVL